MDEVSLCRDRYEALSSQLSKAATSLDEEKVKYMNMERCMEERIAQLEAEARNQEGALLPDQTSCRPLLTIFYR